jgi:hypothetical protein
MGNFGVESGKSCPYQVARERGKKNGVRRQKYLGLAIVQHFTVFPIMLFPGIAVFTFPWNCAAGHWSLAGWPLICIFYVSPACVFLLFVAFHGFHNSSVLGVFALWSLFSFQPPWGTPVPKSGTCWVKGCCIGDWVTGCNLSMAFSLGCIAAKLGVVMEFSN